MRIFIGCSGFSYKDWIATFYPPRIDQSEMITYYEKFFDVVEINYTFYSMPHPYTMESFLERTKRLKFAIKVNEIFTHRRRYSSQDIKRFLEGCEPILQEEKRFIAFLFQFPQSFHYRQENMEYLQNLALEFAGYEKVVEFRSRSFLKVEVLEEVVSFGFSVVNVDAPKIKGLFVGPWKSLGSINYVRLHGRNAQKWHNHKEAYERYDYLYSVEELKDLKAKIERLLPFADTYVFFNNHYRGKGPANALQLKELFGEEVKLPKGLKSLVSPRIWE